MSLGKHQENIDIHDGGRQRKFVHVTYDLDQILNDGILHPGSPRPILQQPLHVKDTPLSFCSFVNSQYPHIYGKTTQGVIFETDAKEVYASPVDTHDFMRSAHFLPGYEKFLFPSVEKMLDRYPSVGTFVKEFKEFIMQLQPSEIYPDMEIDRAQLKLERDYVLSDMYPWKPGCNEVTFRAPTPMRNVQSFRSIEELRNLLDIKPSCEG